jgi:VanZ family protein
MRTIFLSFLLVLAIAYFSSQPFAEQDMRPEIARQERLVENLKKLPPVCFSFQGELLDSRRNPVDFIFFLIRKMAHVFLYGAFGIALADAFKGIARLGKKRFLFAGLVVVLVGAADEFHQTFVPGRTGRSVDVLVDLAGYLFFLLLVALASALWRKLRRSN